MVAWGDFQHRQHYDSHLWTLLVVENYLLQHWQVRCLASDTAGGRPPKRSDARQAQRTLVHGLSEYYTSDLAFGTAQDIVAKLRHSSGADRTHAHLTARIGQLEAMLASERAEAGATRATVFSVLAVVATALLAFPALRETLAIMSDLPSSGWVGTTSAPLRWLAAQGAAGTWGAFLALLLVVAVVWVSTSVRLWGRRRRNASSSTRLSRAGTPWVRGTIEIVREERQGEMTLDPETGTSLPTDDT